MGGNLYDSMVSVNKLVRDWDYLGAETELGWRMAMRPHILNQEHPVLSGLTELRTGTCLRRTVP